MKIHISKHITALSCVLFLAISVAIFRLPILMIAKTTLLFALTIFYFQFVKKYILLQHAHSITHVNCDENHMWSLQTKDKQNILVNLSQKSFVSVNWMCLLFSNQANKKVYRVFLSTDSVPRNQWSLLHLLVKFAKPITKNS